MRKTEAKAAGGIGLSPAEDVKKAITGFVSDFKHFQTEIDVKLQQTEERLTMLDRKTNIPQRTPWAAPQMPVRRIKKRLIHTFALAMMMDCVGWKWM